MEWAQVLVIILSVFLAIFLGLSSVLVVLLIRITRHIRAVTTSAERAAVKAESIVANFSAATNPSVLGKVVTSFVKNFKK